MITALVLAVTIDNKTYEQSEALADFVKLASLVKNAFVVPHWIGETDSFWYKRDLAHGHDYVVVDAATGKKEAAFDAPRFAAVLSKETGTTVAADDLELLAMTTGTTTTYTFQVAGKKYVCSGTACSEQPASLPKDQVLSPDGRYVAFVRNGNLWLRDAQGTSERQLTFDGTGPDYGYGVQPGGDLIEREKYAALGASSSPFGVEWSPDSKTLLVTRVDQRNIAQYPFVETVPGDGSFRPILHLDRIPLLGEHDPDFAYFAVDIPSGTLHRVGLPEGLTVTERWKPFWLPDGSRYIIATSEYQATAALLKISPSTQAVTMVHQETLKPRADLNTAYYNPPNVYVTKDGREVIWFSQRDGWGHLYLYDAATGKQLSQITSGQWLVRDIVSVDEAHRRIYFTGSGREPGNPYYRYLYRINFDGSNLTLLSPEQADHLVVGGGFHFYPFEKPKEYQVVSPSGQYVVYNYSTVSTVPECVIRRTSDASVVATIEKADATALFAAGYRPPHEFTAKAADGVTDLWGVFYAPAHIDSNRRYPIIDSEYTSPLYATTPRDFMAAITGPPSLLSPASLTTLGFGVVGIDARGTPDRSKAFLDYSYGRWDTMGLEDHVAAIRSLAARETYLDLNRVGIVGWSFGGEAATRGLLEFPDFFKVGVAFNPAGGQHTIYSGTEPWIGVPVYSDGGTIRPKPAEVPKSYQPLDSARDASRLKGSLLMFVGELDENVFAASTLHFADALMKANKDFDLIYSPNAAHATTYANFPTYASYIRRRARDYFITHLLRASLPPQPGTDFGEDVQSR